MEACGGAFHGPISGLAGPNTLTNYTNWLTGLTGCALEYSTYTHSLLFSTILCCTLHAIPNGTTHKHKYIHFILCPIVLFLIIIYPKGSIILTPDVLILYTPPRELPPHMLGNMSHKASTQTYPRTIEICNLLSPAVPSDTWMDAPV